MASQKFRSREQAEDFDKADRQLRSLVVGENRRQLEMCRKQGDKYKFAGE